MNSNAGLIIVFVLKRKEIKKIKRLFLQDIIKMKFENQLNSI